MEMKFDGLKIPLGSRVRRGYEAPFGAWLEMEHRRYKRFSLCFFNRDGRWEIFLAPRLPKYGGGWCDAARGFVVDGIFSSEKELMLLLRRGDTHRRLFFVPSRGNALVTDDDGKILWIYRPQGDLTVGKTFEPAGDFAEMEAEMSPDEFGEALSRGLRQYCEIRDGFLARKVFSLLRQEIKRTERAIEAVENDRRKLGDPEKLSRLADIIMANLHAIPAGASSAQVVDPYTGERITVELDPSVAPVKYAEKLYARARKARHGAEATARRLEELSARLEKLRQLETETDFARVAQFLGVDPAEFLGTPESEKSTGEKKDYGAGIKRFVSSDGFEILVGRSAEANNRLTFHIAGKDDIWLHAQGVKGSHTVIKTAGRQVPRRTIEQAASLAAFYSDAKHSSLVPVIYTRRRYVHPVKGKPGLVRIDRGETIFVEPRERPEG